MEKRRLCKAALNEDGSLYVRRSLGKGNEGEVRFALPIFKKLKPGQEVAITISKDGRTFTGEIV